VIGKTSCWIICFFWLTHTVSAGMLPEFSDMVAEAGEAVVNISTEQKERLAHQGGQQVVLKGGRASGSGFVISEDGYIVTNQHVVQNADKILVKFKDRHELNAQVIGFDKATDIALLKVQATQLPVIKIGLPEQLKVGEWVVAIGSPFGFEQSVTAGIVSAKNRAVAPETYVPFIQTDVAINPGNSGGPLFNLDGEVVGINSWILSQTGGYMGMSFAIPIDVVMNVSEQLKKTGKVSRGWLGVQLQEVSVALTQLLAMERTRGAMVSEVFSDSPAERAGLMVGDVILAIAGQTIETAMELPPKIGILMAGDTTALEIIRKGETKTLQVQVGLLPETTLLKAENFAIITARLGITVDNFLEEGKNSSRGVLIRTVNTEAALTAGLRQGDIILGMNDTLIRDVADLTQKLSDMMQNTRISVLIQRNKERFFLPLTVL